MSLKISNFRREIGHNLVNMPGWHTKRHVVVIESDDWGAIRMPSREVYNQFLKEGIAVDRDPYCRYDRLATKNDLEGLFEVLDSVKDKNGNPAVLTANAVVANPVFKKIAESGFKEYSYEPFTETLKQSNEHEGAWEMWHQGMNEGLFRPQFHGREHLNVKKWLSVLQQGDSTTRRAFELSSFGLTDSVDSAIKRNYMGAFNSGLDEDITYYGQILKEGMDLFEKLFGYRSASFIATTYTWNPRIEPHLISGGVKYIQGLITQKIPIDDDTSIKFVKKGYQGTKTEYGLIRLMRNCFFEPSQTPNVDCVDDCLHRIELAFRWRKAAVICAHRLNFIGSIDHKNTDRNLPMFKSLLKEIVKRWPDVEFVSSDQLGVIIDNYYDKNKA